MEVREVSVGRPALHKQRARAPTGNRDPDGVRCSYTVADIQEVSEALFGLKSPQKRDSAAVCAVSAEPPGGILSDGGGVTQRARHTCARHHLDPNVRSQALRDSGTRR